MRSTGNPRLDVVVIAFDSDPLLRRCLDSLAVHPPEAGYGRVVIVDNAGLESTRELIEPRAGAEWVGRPDNPGFGRAANLGAAMGEAPYLAVLNPDVAIRADTFDRLIDELDAHPAAGCAGPKLVTESGELDHAARRSFPTPLSALGHFSGLGRRGGGRLAAYRAPEVERGEVDAVNGAFMLMRRSAFEGVGGFDPGYWMYMEDLDLNWRLREAGWSTRYVPEAVALHSKGGTTEGRRSAKLQLHFHRGMGRFYRAHYGPGHSPAYNLMIYAGIGAKLLASLVASRVRRA